MSQSRITPEQEPPATVVWWHVALGLAILLTAVAAVFFAANWIHSTPSHYTTATGEVWRLGKWSTTPATRYTASGSAIALRRMFGTW